MLRKYRFRDYDFKLVIMLIAISVIGILVVGSAEKSIQNKQILGLILGVVLMVTISLFDYSVLLKFYWVFYIATIGLLLYVRFFGDDVNNARRWVSIAGITFQPSETAKILLILFYAQFIMKYKEKLNTFRILAASMVLLIPPWVLIYKQPDLSTSIIILVIFCVILFVGGLSYKIIFSFLAIVVPLAVAFIAIVLQPDQTLLRDYQQERILAWLNPEKYASTTAYQQVNSVMAIGSGQLFGKSLGNSSIMSMKNGNFIPEPQTDFIFTIVGEELGFIGAAAVIILLMLIAVECMMIGRTAKDMAGTVICSGVAAIVGFQSFINIAVTTMIIPNTGIPLPFVSAGLTSLVSLFIGMGFVLNIRLQRKRM